MKIDAALIIRQRMLKGWTQEQLAGASGLSKRTIQRVEREASASMETQKALAATFNLDYTSLTLKEARVMKKYEYKTVELPFKLRFFKSGTPDVQSLLNAEGQNGWQLKQVVIPASGFGESDSMVVILERETA
ncbi:DUF4177 domain-containing protein [Pseudoalteromonas piscicida]|uniref:DUF4177 domain-containing protein n=1 Tax=Pseudoalteromonas piscicida TaxID=43662 RepID=A0AAQ2EVY4_PSEO7|nr:MULTISPECIES: DUF4177 domain-containing protein [Pseudoalteromonas]MCG9771582.1 DUF4177 domain-containing protein [Pseudoalteromonas piscicida]MDP4489777.1 DUF4177 domain-containing protein [Pseudoalteromonas piscicida]TMN35021.1 DUF4177 domain-containing protein [Pseudoalteromonas piscicida]TMN39222.1 DUF4177 domain-containing protein [Pseudoalteromonas piscicida]TMN49912.1 DUF4177 domain-containing protein [Pseudoalteromonas piscicida]